MYRIAPLALCAALGVAALVHGAPANAQPLITVGVGLPAVAVVAPPFVAYAPPYFYRGYFWHGYRYAYPYRYGYRHGRPYYRR